MKSWKKNLAILCGNLLLLGLFYWLCRYALLDLHGMKSWADILAGFTLILLVNSWAFKKKWFSFFAVIGYPCGFGIGLALNQDTVTSMGTRANNFWILWAAGLLGFLVLGFAVELFAARKQKKAQAEQKNGESA